MAINNKPIRVLVLTTSFPRFLNDEASVFVGRLIDAFSEIGLSGIVAVPFDNDEEPAERRGNFDIIRKKYGILKKGALAFGYGILPNIRKNKLLILQAPYMLISLALTGYKTRDKWDVIHANWIASAIPAFFLKLTTGKKYILTIRGEDIKLLHSPLKYILNTFVKNAAHISTVSHDFEKELKELFPNKTDFISAAPNGVTRYVIEPEKREEFCTTHNLNPNWRVLTYTGRVVPLKQPEFLIHLLSYIQNSEYHLILAGRVENSYREKLLSLIDSLSLSKNVHILGSIAPQDVGTLLSITSLYLSASTHEGRSNSILEALAAGVPACVSKIPGHEEIVKDGENGLLFPAHNLTEDAKQAAIYITDTLKDDTKMWRLSGEAKESVKHLTWLRTAEKFREIFHS